MPGLASLLSRRTTNPRAAGAAAMLRNRPRPWAMPTWPGRRPPPGGKHGGYVEGYQGGGEADYVPQQPRTPAEQAAWERRRAQLIAEADARARAAARAKAKARAGYLTSTAPRGGPRGGQTGGVVGYQGGGRAGIGRGGPPLPPMPQGWQGASVPVGPNIPIPPRRRGPGGWQEGGPVGVAPEEVAMASEIFARATPEQQDQITGGGGAPAMEEEAAIGEALAMALGGGGGGPLMNGGGPPMNGAPPMGGLI